MTLDTNIANVKARIANAVRDANRSPDDVNLLAVSKTRTAETIRAAHNLGLHQFGENYVQEALDKQTALTDLDIEWHFIGPIQSNKTKDIATHFSWVHTVEREKIAKRLNTAATGTINVCIQVNISGEAAKSGVAPDDIFELATFINSCEKLTLRGLMAIPAATNDKTEQRQAFAKMHALFIELKQRYPHIDTLSMGMSQDLEPAITEGASIVRIGTDIFGPRN